MGMEGMSVGWGLLGVHGVEGGRVWVRGAQGSTGMEGTGVGRGSPGVHRDGGDRCGLGAPWGPQGRGDKCGLGEPGGLFGQMGPGDWRPDFFRWAG